MIAQRDFRLYPLYKRAGNWVMSAWASIWSGRRFTDVESGYRAFRVGPLLDALQYYKGYKYSETVEVAVILPILGYTIHDTTLVDIPVFRSRTRMKDVIIDLVAMPCAWWRVMAARRLPAGIPTWVAYWVLPLFFALAAAGMLRILSRTIYLADDTINHYAHVWYISDQLYGSGTIPLRFTELDGGRAFTYPYAIAPWTLNALVYPAPRRLVRNAVPRARRARRHRRRAARAPCHARSVAPRAVRLQPVLHRCAGEWPVRLPLVRCGLFRLRLGHRAP